jgi:hypothetical protein
MPILTINRLNHSVEKYKEKESANVYLGSVFIPIVYT